MEMIFMNKLYMSRKEVWQASLPKELEVWGLRDHMVLEITESTKLQKPGLACPIKVSKKDTVRLVAEISSHHAAPGKPRQ